MADRSFYAWLGGISVAAAGLVGLFNQLSLTRPFQTFSWLCLAFFLLLTVLIYVLGSKAARSANPNHFIQTVIGIMAIKMFLSAILILVYFKTVQPQSKWFLLPFFSLYLAYTIFETYILMRLGRLNT